MKVGDLVRRDVPQTLDEQGREMLRYGIVMRLSRTGHHTTAAEVQWDDGSVSWADGVDVPVRSEK